MESLSDTLKDPFCHSWSPTTPLLGEGPVPLSSLTGDGSSFPLGCCISEMAPYLPALGSRWWIQSFWNLEMLAAQARDIGRRVEDKADEFTLQIRWQWVITMHSIAHSSTPEPPCIAGSRDRSQTVEPTWRWLCAVTWFTRNSGSFHFLWQLCKHQVSSNLSFLTPEFQCICCLLSLVTDPSFPVPSEKESVALITKIKQTETTEAKFACPYLRIVLGYKLYQWHHMSQPAWSEGGGVGWVCSLFCVFVFIM